MIQTYRDLTISELFFNNNIQLASGELKNNYPLNYANGGVTDSLKTAKPAANIDLAKPIFENSNSGTNAKGFLQKNLGLIIVLTILCGVIYFGTRQQKKNKVTPARTPDEGNKTTTNTN